MKDTQTELADQRIPDTQTTQVKIAAEAGHWYKRDGTPCYEVPNASKPGETRPTTLRDAKKLDLVPSVTTILRVAAAPGLDRWKQLNLLHAALTLPRLENETEDAFAERAIEDAAEQARKAREKGTAIHGAIEKYLADKTGAVDEFAPHVCAAVAALGTAGLSTLDAIAEHSFAHPDGYGGKIDFHTPVAVVDFKTKAKWTGADLKRGLAYDDHGMQLVAYAHGLGIRSPRLLNIFIATDEPGKFHVHEWPADDHQRLLGQFFCLLNYWKLANL